LESITVTGVQALNQATCNGSAVQSEALTLTLEATQPLVVELESITVAGAQALTQAANMFGAVSSTSSTASLKTIIVAQLSAQSALVRGESYARKTENTDLKLPLQVELESFMVTGVQALNQAAHMFGVVCSTSSVASRKSSIVAQLSAPTALVRGESCARQSDKTDLKLPRVVELESTSVAQLPVHSENIMLTLEATLPIMVKLDPAVARLKVRKGSTVMDKVVFCTMHESDYNNNNKFGSGHINTCLFMKLRPRHRRPRLSQCHMPESEHFKKFGSDHVNKSTCFDSCLFPVPAFCSGSSSFVFAASHSRAFVATNL
jgi:hypothetical protein